MKIKFLTLNIYNGNFLAECISFLKKEDPDIFVLQEVYKGGFSEQDKKYRSLEIIRDDFKNYYFYYSPEYFKRVDSIKIESGNVIFSKFPIKEKNTEFYAGEYRERKEENESEFLTCGRNLQAVILRITDRSINIFNTHGIWGFDGKDSPQRLKMSKVITDQIKAKNKVILAGDFNLNPSTAAVKNIERHLRNVFANSLKSTFNLKLKAEGLKRGLYHIKKADLESFAVSAVDMIFVTPNIKVLKKYQLKADVSDHYPLVAELEI